MTFQTTPTPDYDVDLVAQKVQLRLEMKARRAHLNEAGRARAAWLLGERLFTWLEGRPERVIGVYLARPFEISLDSLAQTLIRHGFTVAAPRLDLQSKTLDFWRLTNLENVRIGPYQVREPFVDERFVDERVMPEIVIAPGLAFDPRGNRLGTGGGWYDSVLGAVPLKIGVSFDNLIVPAVPHEAHDVRVDYVASDMRWFECNRTRNANSGVP